MRSGWPLGATSLNDRVERDNNMRIETQTSNYAKSNFAESQYAEIRELVLETRVPKGYANKDLVLTPYNAELEGRLLAKVRSAHSTHSPHIPHTPHQVEEVGDLPRLNDDEASAFEDGDELELQKEMEMVSEMIEEAEFLGEDGEEVEDGEGLDVITEEKERPVKMELELESESEWGGLARCRAMYR